MKAPSTLLVAVEAMLPKQTARGFWGASDARCVLCAEFGKGRFPVQAKPDALAFPRAPLICPLCAVAVIRVSLAVAMHGPAALLPLVRSGVLGCPAPPLPAAHVAYRLPGRCLACGWSVSRHRAPAGGEA